MEPSLWIRRVAAQKKIVYFGVWIGRDKTDRHELCTRSVTSAIILQLARNEFQQSTGHFRMMGVDELQCAMRHSHELCVS